jgi:hypothetical protein
LKVNPPQVGNILNARSEDMKTRYLMLAGVLLLGAAALVGCSRDGSAREGGRQARGPAGVGPTAQTAMAAAQRLGGRGGGYQGESHREGGYQGGAYQGARALQGQDGAVRQAAPAPGANPGTPVPGAGRADCNQLSSSILDTGIRSSLTGTLSYQAPEWYLAAAEGRYVLRLGNARYVESTGIVLEEGVRATVRGFLADGELTVVAVELGGREYAFRTEEGRPLWAGISGGRRGG